jgi:hypothetical protein
VRRQSDGGWLDLNALPAALDVAYSPERLDEWERLTALVGLLDGRPALRRPLTWEEWNAPWPSDATVLGLRDAFSLAPDTAVPGEPGLLALLDLAELASPRAREPFLRVLGARTGWNPEDVTFVVETVFGLPAPAADPTAPFRLANVRESRSERLSRLL